MTLFTYIFGSIGTFVADELEAIFPVQNWVDHLHYGSALIGMSLDVWIYYPSTDINFPLPEEKKDLKTPIIPWADLSLTPVSCKLDMKYQFFYDQTCDRI